MKVLRVVHYPQENSKPFIVEVDKLIEAKLVLDTLANYDFFLFNNKLNPEYPNSASVEVYDDEEKKWNTWVDQNTGNGNLHEFFEAIERERQSGINMLF